MSKTNNFELEILPAFSSQNAPIVFESSSFFIPYLAVALQTIIDTAKPENNYDIIVLGDGVKPLDQERILQQVAGMDNFSVRFFEPQAYIDFYFQKAKYQYLKINYYRLALPWILKSYKTAVNLGADIIVMKDISELTGFKFEQEKYLTGSVDLGYIGRLNEDIPHSELALKHPNRYINADVLIYNLEGIRNNYRLDDIMEFWQRYHLRCAEQDALNKIFDEHKQLLSLRWNTYPERMTSTQDIMCTTPMQIELWKKTLKNPSLVHFAAVPKPWSYPIIGFSDIWWKAARRTIFYEEILRRMSVPQKRKRKHFLERIMDALFPKGTRRRAFFKRYVLNVHWGMTP